jgi:hypothetical protein
MTSKYVTIIEDTLEAYTASNSSGQLNPVGREVLW